MKGESLVLSTPFRFRQHWQLPCSVPPLLIDAGKVPHLDAEGASGRPVLLVAGAAAPATLAADIPMIRFCPWQLRQQPATVDSQETYYFRNDFIRSQHRCKINNLCLILALTYCYRPNRAVSLRFLVERRGFGRLMKSAGHGRGQKKTVD